MSQPSPIAAAKPAKLPEISVGSSRGWVRNASMRGTQRIARSGAEAHHVRHVVIEGEHCPGIAQQTGLISIETAGSGARKGFQHVDRRVAAAFADAAIEHDMPIEYAAHRVRDRFIVVAAFHQYGEQCRDLPRRAIGPHRPRPRALQQYRQFGEDARRVTARRRRFARRQANLTQREAETGDAVHQQQHGFAFIGKMLGDGHRRIGGLAPHQRRRVGGRDYHHRAREPLRPQIVLEELAHFAAALTHQRQNGDIALGVARQHGEQG
jgi:hypothetical protein